MIFKEYESLDMFKNDGFKMIYECPCSGKYEIFEEEVQIEISSVKLHFRDLHVLKCLKCGHFLFPCRSSQLIIGAYNETISKNHTLGLFNRSDYRKKFDYCVQHEFKYDFYDLYNIPGLIIREYYDKEGFLTPVFFDKKVFNYFFMDENYFINLFAETYGSFSFKDNWDIPFGININDKIVFWLGDLDMLDNRTLDLMLPFNIESDHKLINSEFYAAQLCSIWAKPNMEFQIYLNRNKFYDAIKNKYSIDLYHLENEVNVMMDQYNKPINVNKTTFVNIIATLHKLIIEAVNLNALKEICKKLNVKENDKFKKIKSIKTYELILIALIQDLNKVKKIISPIYILNDLRIYFDHLLSDVEQKKLERNILDVLKIDTINDVYKTYKILLEKLNCFYSYLNLIILSHE